MQKIIIGLYFFFVGLVSLSAQQSQVFTTDGKAIRGYDAVAYFTEGKAIKGDSKFTYQWGGSDWFFATAANLNSFRQEPQKFVPQYGGYCAYGMANGYKAPTDNEAWSIVDGKLYLNYNKDVQKMWKEKQKEFIVTADKNWPGVKNKG